MTPNQLLTELAYIALLVAVQWWLLVLTSVALLIALLEKNPHAA